MQTAERAQGHSTADTLRYSSIPNYRECCVAAVCSIERPVLPAWRMVSCILQHFRMMSPMVQPVPHTVERCCSVSRTSNDSAQPEAADLLLIWRQTAPHQNRSRERVTTTPHIKRLILRIDGPNASMVQPRNRSSNSSTTKGQMQA